MRHLEEAVALQRDVERIAGACSAPGMNSWLTSASWVPWPMPTRRTSAPPGPDRRVQAGLVADVGGVRYGAFEAGRVDVGQVVGHDVELALAGQHAA